MKTVKTVKALKRLTGMRNGTKVMLQGVGIFVYEKRRSMTNDSGFIFMPKTFRRI